MDALAPEGSVACDPIAVPLSSIVATQVVRRVRTDGSVSGYAWGIDPRHARPERDPHQDGHDGAPSRIVSNKERPTSEGLQKRSPKSVERRPACRRRAWDLSFRKRLAELGWADGRNVRIDARWTGGSMDRTKQFANELVRLNPDVLVAVTTPATAAMQHETRTIPIIFTSVSDPVGSGFVASLPNPGGNITGFINMEASLSGKWVELIREIVPHVSRMAILFNPQSAPFARYYLDTFRSAATALSVESIEAPVHSPAEIEDVMTKLGRETLTGIVVMPDTSAVVNRSMIISLAERYRLPTIYPLRVFVIDGGLISYGIDYPEMFRKAASYVDRILRGAKPNELPVQLPTKFELVINLKTAKSIGLTFPQTIVASADDVIE
jgi:putative tryptophan/tyrosine transport system substrate-binding protein